MLCSGKGQRKPFRVINDEKENRPIYWGKKRKIKKKGEKPRSVNNSEGGEGKKTIEHELEGVQRIGSEQKFTQVHQKKHDTTGKKEGKKH